MPAKKTAQRKGVDQLTLLGNTAAKYPAEYTPDVLEAVPSPAAQDYWVKFNCPEFTSLCPKTGQPDYATITISYVPDKLIVESKSLKLYLFGFRNHGDFHEDVVNVIYYDLTRLLKPKYLEVIGKFAARGGISIDPFVNGGTGAKYRALAQKRFEGWNGVRD